MNIMKNTALCSWTAVCVSVLLAAATCQASADDTATPTVKQAPRPEHYSAYTGIVDEVNAKEHRLVLRNVMFTKTFNLGDSCTYAFLDKDARAINSLRPGQKVTVDYQNANGVLVARSVRQQPMRYEGTVRSIDLNRQTMVLNTGAVNRDVALGNDCQVTLRDDKSGALADIKPGHHVLVTYDAPHGDFVARQIAQTSDTFSGSLTSIDLTDRTLKARSTFSAKKFNVGKGCTFVIHGRTDGQLRDLKPGDDLVLNYDTVDGVNVVNRVAIGEAPAAATAAAQTQYQYP
jgi:Cu/Ag efflux protein CusF